MCAFGDNSPFLLLESTACTHTCTWTECLGGKGRAH